MKCIPQNSGSGGGVSPLCVAAIQNFSYLLVWSAGKAEDSDVTAVISCVRHTLSHTHKPLLWEWGEAIVGYTPVR